jgi:hypothetical protein
MLVRLFVECLNGWVTNVTGRAAERGGWTGKNVYTKSERLTHSFRVTWAWSEWLNIYN